jgi:hypothetical protein
LLQEEEALSVEGEALLAVVVEGPVVLAVVEHCLFRQDQAGPECA